MTTNKQLLNARIHVVEGNSKLEGNDDISFLIFNLPARTTCPHRTELCSFICYAASEERYTNVVKSRKENFDESFNNDEFEANMIEHIEYHLNRKKNANKTIYFRIHSSGDFYNQSYFNKWVNIANHFKGNDKIVFEAYTKSLPFVEAYGQLEDINITLVYSVMSDTKPVQVEKARNLGMKLFRAVPIGTDETGFKCPGKCGQCGACYDKQNGINDIFIEYHGYRAKSAIK